MMNMVFTEDVVTEITSSVWRAFLPESDDVIPIPMVPSPASLTGTVFISGQWNGLVSLTCSSVAAVRAAALMFAADLEEVDQGDVLDAVGELVNIVGGNLKGMLPSPTGLSLPSVNEGGLDIDSKAGAELLVDVQLAWMNEPVHVAIWGMDGPPPGQTT
jgi:chemotaxis protein CheX